MSQPASFRIDLNSDLGESFGAWQMGDDETILGMVTSANVACGFHAGDPKSILATLRLAAERGVTVGAHVGYPDLVGFGRRDMSLSHDELEADVIYQIGALQALARAAGTSVKYVKPHGALYNTIARDEQQAAAVLSAIREVDQSLPLVCLAGAPLVEQAEASGVRAVQEAFADRAYEADGSLVSRRLPGAVLHDPNVVAERMLKLVTHGVVTARTGEEVRLQAESICVHGDSPDAVALARAVSSHLVNNGVSLEAFVQGTAE